ncbi:MAG: endonuclease/exonuclease/phosphatase family protein [Fimbriimonas sp.]|nr:endonuclease/exonuclease/phosphatase family protein [Fimbriimonas sp.]
MAEPHALLKVMTFNIRYGTAEDGPNSWAFRRDSALQLLRDSDCAVIGMQEVLAGQLNEILSELPYMRSIGVGRDDGAAEGEFNPILYDARMVELIDSETFWFSDTPQIPGSSTWGNINIRICTRGSFLFGGREFEIYNLHIDHEVELSRQKSIELLAQRVASSPLDRPVLVTGDFNAGEASEPVAMMHAAGFVDTYRSIYTDLAESATYHGWADLYDGEKIDYIFAMGEVEVIDAAIVRDKPFSRFPSDHYAVTAVVR